MRPFSKAPALVQIVLILLVVEALILAAVFFSLLFELFSGQFQSIYAEVFLLVLAAGATLWVLQFSRGLLNKNAGQEVQHSFGNYFKPLLAPVQLQKPEPAE
jgi:hypothetical protein